MSIFQQIYVNISKTCQYFVKSMSNRCRNPPWRRGFLPWGLAGILSAPVQKFRLYVDIRVLTCRLKSTELFASLKFWSPSINRLDLPVGQKWFVDLQVNQLESETHRDTTQWPWKGSRNTPQGFLRATNNLENSMEVNFFCNGNARRRSSLPIFFYTVGSQTCEIPLILNWFFKLLGCVLDVLGRLWCPFGPSGRP